MKYMALVIIATLVASEAKTENIFKAEESKPTGGVTSAPQTHVNHEKPIKPKPTTLTNKSLDTITRAWTMIGEGQVTITGQNAADYLTELKGGQIVTAEIPMSVMAFSDGKAPVVATIRSQSGEDFRALGEATVEKNSKRISIEFKKIRRTGSDKVFDLKAQALDRDGTYGLEGEVHTGEVKFFLAELLSAAGAGFADASIHRSTNALGNQVDENSLDTQSKKAVSSAMNKSAEHFAEKLKANQEYVTVDGPLNVRVVILEGPKMKASSN